MPIREALIIEAGGERFRFYYDLEVPEVLHVTLRHGTSPEDAIRTFFEGETSAWDENARDSRRSPRRTASTGRATRAISQ